MENSKEQEIREKKNKYARDYYEKNRERLAEYKLKKYHDNIENVDREKMSKYGRMYYAENKERIRKEYKKKRDDLVKLGGNEKNSKNKYWGDNATLLKDIQFLFEPERRRGNYKK
jgi:hypothetical protein